MATSVTLTVQVSSDEPAIAMETERDSNARRGPTPKGVRADLGLRQGRSNRYWQLQSEERLAEKSGKEPGSIAGGRLLEPAPVTPGQTETQVQVLSWATGSGDLNSNNSHAEHQFYNWFDSQPDEWKRRVTRIDVRNNPYSPCSQCAGELASLLRENPHIEVAFLTWQKPWDAGILNTTKQDLNEMIGKGWVVHPGPNALDRLGDSC